MSDEIRFDINSLEGQIALLKSAMVTMDGYQKFMEGAVTSIQQNTSATTKTLSSTLNNMRDTKAPEVVRKAGKLIGDLRGTKNAAEEFNRMLSESVTNTPGRGNYGLP